MPSLTIFKQALSVLLWLIVHDFLEATKLNCQKCKVFSNANTLLFSHENKMQEFKFLTFVNIFYRLGIERKKIVSNIEQWKNEGKVMWNLSDFVKTFMITQNKGEWPTCSALTSVAEQFSN